MQNCLVHSDESACGKSGRLGMEQVSFLMDSNFFPIVLHCLILTVPNLHDSQRVTPPLKYRNIDGRNPSFASLNMDLGWR